MSEELSYRKERITSEDAIFIDIDPDVFDAAQCEEILLSYHEVYPHNNIFINLKGMYRTRVEKYHSDFPKRILYVFYDDKIEDVEKTRITNNKFCMDIIKYNPKAGSCFCGERYDEVYCDSRLFNCRDMFMSMVSSFLHEGKFTWI